MAIPAFTKGQVLWSESFNGTNPYTNVDTNTTDQSSVGSAGANYWTINANYTGVPPVVPNTPAQPAAIVGSPNSNYLHIAGRVGLSQTPPISNATYDPTTPVNEKYFATVTTGLSTTGLTGVTMDFYFLSAAGSGAEVFVKDGAAGTWTQLASADFSNALVNTAAWTNTTYNGSALDNLNNVVLGFSYEVINIGPASTFPSFSIDDININAPSSGVVAALQQPTLPLPQTCMNDTIDFIADNSSGAITNFLWLYNGAANGAQTATGQNVTFVAGAPGAYTMQLVVTNGLVNDTLDMPINIISCTTPVINISGVPTTLCTGDSVNFQDNSVPGASPIISRQWSFPGGSPGTTNATNPKIQYNTAGTYDVYFAITDANGTYYDTLYDYIEVVSCPPPVVDFTSDRTVICPGEGVNFLDMSSNVSVGNVTWTWSFPGGLPSGSNAQNPTNIVYQTPGTYDVILTVENDNGIDDMVKVGYITVDSCLGPQAQFRSQADTICEGNCVQFFNQSLRADSISWIVETATGYDTLYENNPIVCFDEVGEYDVRLFTYNEYGNDYAGGKDYLTVGPYPNILAGDDKEIYIGNETQLTAFGSGEYYVWSPAQYLSCSVCREPYASPEENTWYFVTNINEYGCSSMDSLRVLVNKQYFSGMPDIFSPNGDGENDYLMVLGNGIANVEMYVYDRFGQIVFQSIDLEDQWDGTFKGQNVDQGTYTYLVKVTQINGYQELLQGTVQLVR